MCQNVLLIFQIRYVRDRSLTYYVFEYSTELSFIHFIILFFSTCVALACAFTCAPTDTEPDGTDFPNACFRVNELHVFIH